MANLTLDKSKYQAFSGREALNLDPKEFDILWLLAEKPGKTYKEKELFQEIKRSYPQIEASPFKKYVHQLRYKLNRRFIEIIDDNCYRIMF